MKRKIQELGYKRRVPKKKVAIREVNKKAWCKLCKERRNWTADHDWSKWVFSDEIQIVIGKKSGSLYMEKRRLKNTMRNLCVRHLDDI